MAEIANSIPVDELKKHLRYDPQTGKLFWLTAYKQLHIGREAGAFQGRYLNVKVKRRILLVHRVAWALHHGQWPDKQLDHINGDKTDNRILNLRLAENWQNQANRKVSANGCGFKGVTKRVRCGRTFYEANIEISKAVGGDKRRCVYLGQHPTAEEASRAYAAAASKHFGDFARAVEP